MKQVFVGCYYLGNMQVDLYLREGSGGDFYSTPEPRQVPRIKVGADYDEWSQVLRVLMHETFELSMFVEHARYSPTNDCGHDHANYLFILNHYQFSNCCGRVGEYVAGCLYDLHAAWRDWQGRPTTEQDGSGI